MSTLLQIRTNLTGPLGLSARLAERFERDWRKRHPDGRIVTRDLATDPVPHLNAQRFAAFLAKPEERTPEQQAIVRYSD